MPLLEDEFVTAVRERLRFYSGLGFLGLICVLWLPAAILLHLLLPRAPGRRLGRFVIHIGMRWYLQWLEWIGACRFDLADIEGLRDRGPLILVANHPVLIDAPLILSCLPDLVCVMKADLLSNPLLGSAARLARYVPNEPTVGMVLGAIESLRQGSQLLLFPEGTRTTTQAVGPFTPATALIARRAQVPIQTLLIETDSPFMSKQWSVFRQPQMPIHYRVRLGECFVAQEDHAALTRDLEAYFASNLAPVGHLSPPRS